MQQPVIEEGNVGYETPSVRSYDDLFPALPDSASVTGQNSQPASGWHQRTNKMRVSSSVITQVFRVPFEERKLDHSQKFGEGESIQTCANIMKDTGAHIEISHGKDQSLTFLLTGKPNEVLGARRKILVHFQTQANKQISIPKEHHGWILGKKGDRLKDLEKQTATKISVPPMNDSSDIITISGTKEGIEKAEHEIRVASDQQSKKASERLIIPRMYHPFIAGAFNENVNQLAMETGAKINIPPPSVGKDEIFIAGDKEGVAAAKAKIEAIWKEMEKKCNTVCVEVPKEQHKYVVGPKGSTIAEILQTTGVSVEMPTGDSIVTITLRGPQDKLGFALSKVYEKANSVKSCYVDAPAWLHKYIIGKKGQTIKEITQNMEKIHVEFTSDDKIRIQGPPEEVEKVQEQIEAMAKDLVKKMTYVEKHVDTKLFKHIIGKNGTNINKLREEYNVTINIDESGLIRIEGNRDEIQNINQELEEKIHKLENEKEKDVIIPQRLYRNIIGVKGANIKDIKNRFNQVQIIFPGPGERNEIVKVRGPKEDVDKCCRHLDKLVKELSESSCHVEVPVNKQFHKFIIGKDGVNIKKIREETQTTIDLPSEGDKSDAIVITGKKENVEKAAKMIRKIRDEHESIVEEEITISPKFYNSIIGTKGKLIKLIQEDCGNVTIKFPQPECKSDKVTISGSKPDVERAKQQLLERVNEKKASSFSVELRAKPEDHKYLIGKDGSKIKKIRDTTGARIEFPSNPDEDREVIKIIGKEESVEEARKMLEASIKELEDKTQTKITVDSKHHKHFVARRAEKLNQINDEYGVQTSFPRFGGEVDDQVTITGPKKAVEAAIVRIREIVSDLESMITIECIIPQKHHRSVMGAKGHKVQGITSEFDVQVKFPDRDSYDPSQTNGDVDPEEVRPCDIIIITGKEENCLKAKQALLDLVPISIHVEVPYDLHRSIIGQKGRGVKELMSRFDVHIELSPPEIKEDVIKITGAPYNVEDAKEALMERVKELEADRKDRELRSFSLKMEVNPDHHPKIIGKRGAVITKIKEEHEVQINLPRKGDPEEHIITITGYQHKAEAARDAILKIVNDLNNIYREEIEIDSRVHSRLIGARGRSIHKIMDDYKVEIKFPRSDDANPNLVVISGQQENVLEARDHLLNLEEEYLQDYEEQAQRSQSHTFNLHFDNVGGSQSHRGSRNEHNGFVVQGGPWEQRAPNTNSVTEFPSFGRNTEEPPRHTPVAGAWGSRR